MDSAPHGPAHATLYKVAAGLLLLLALTVGLSFIDMGPGNLVVALVIAAAKAVLVILFFMEVRYSSHLVWIMSGLGLLWLFILMGGTLADYLTRANLSLPSVTARWEAQDKPITLVPTDEHTWRNSNPADTRNAGNLGPGGAGAPAGVEPSAVAGTPGERVPHTDSEPSDTPGSNREPTVH